MTDPWHGKPRARLALGPGELRLYVVALLAIVFTVAWRVIGGPTPGDPPPVAASSTPPRSSVTPVAAPREPARVVYRPTPRRLRVRTRSS